MTEKKIRNSDFKNGRNWRIEIIIKFFFESSMSLLILGALAIISSIFFDQGGFAYYILGEIAVYSFTLFVVPFVFLSFFFAAGLNVLNFKISPKGLSIIKRIFFLFFYPFISVWLAAGLSAIFKMNSSEYQGILTQEELFYSFWVLVTAIYSIPIILGLFFRVVRFLIKHESKKRQYYYLSEEDIIDLEKQITKEQKK